MTPRACVGARLLGRLATQTLALDLVQQRPWASALFVGTRVTIAVASDDDTALDEWLIALPERDVALPGHFVASAEVVERRANAATIELLVVEG